MKRLLPFLSFFLVSSWVSAEPLKTVFNPFTGKQDYITRLDTTSVQAGTNITVSTNSKGVVINGTGGGGSGPSGQINSGTSPDLSYYSVAGSSNVLSDVGVSTASFIYNTSTLQSGATFYVSSGTVQGQLNLVTDSGVNLIFNQLTPGHNELRTRYGSAGPLFGWDNTGFFSWYDNNFLTLTTLATSGSNYGLFNNTYGILAGSLTVTGATTTINSVNMIWPSSGTVGNVLSYSSTNTLQWIAQSAGGGGTPASPTNSVQYNNSGSFGGSSNFTFNGTSATIDGARLYFPTSNSYIGSNAGGPTPPTSTEANTAVGSNSTQQITTGQNNTALGYFSHDRLTTGNFNTSVGAGAGDDIISGYGNTCVGGGNNQWQPCQSITVGSSNTMVGAGTGSINDFTNDTANTYIGFQAGPAGGPSSIGGGAAGALFNAMALGAYATVVTSNTAQIGGTGVYAVTVNMSTMTVSSATIATLNISSPVVVGGTSGTSGQILTSGGPGLPPAWSTSGNVSLSSTNTWTAGQTFISSVTATVGIKTSTINITGVGIAFGDMITAASTLHVVTGAVGINKAATGNALDVSGNVIADNHVGAPYFQNTNTLTPAVAINASGANFGSIENRTATSWDLGYTGDATLLGTAVLKWGSSPFVDILSSATVQGANGLNVSFGVVAGSVTASNLTSGQCVQTGTGGILTVTGSACGSGGGGPTLIATQTWSGQNNWTTPAQSTFTYGLTVGTLTLSGSGNMSVTENGITGQVVLSTAGASVTAGHCAQFGSSMTIVDAGASCGTGGGGGTPATPFNSVQYNNAGSFGGSNNFQFNGTSVTIFSSMSITTNGSSLAGNLISIFSSNSAGNILQIGGTATSPLLTIPYNAPLIMSGSGAHIGNLQIGGRADGDNVGDPQSLSEVPNTGGGSQGISCYDSAGNLDLGTASTSVGGVNGSIKFTIGDSQFGNGTGTTEMVISSFGVTVSTTATLQSSVTINSFALVQPASTSTTAVVIKSTSGTNILAIDNTAVATNDYVLKVSSGDASTMLFGFQNTSHFVSSGTAPGVTSCGISPSVIGTDMAGVITIGSGVTTSCTLSFNNPYINAPVCVISDNSTAITGDISSVSTTAVTFSFSASLGSGQVYYICIGNKG